MLHQILSWLLMLALVEHTYSAAASFQIGKMQHIHETFPVFAHSLYLSDNPGYYDISAQDMSVWHVPNNFPLEHWNLASILRYHTNNRFFSLYGGNLFELYQQYPVRYNIGSCSDRGPAFPIVYDFGDKESTKQLYGPNPRAQFEPGFITFRPISTHRVAMAICSGVKPTTGCDTGHYCIGGGGYFYPNQCGDFAGFDWDRVAGTSGWSTSKELRESAVLLFYR
uniref:Uncharacterized protein n=1 Tax=Acanthochromis polyacanthus TaxID=80966 RepID=A0A3Q1EP25_9TELE